MTVSKIMLLGEIGVGKSSIVRRLVFDKFEMQYTPTIGVDVYRYIVPIPEGGTHNLIVWDTDGNYAEAIFRHVYMRQASAALVVADIARPETIVHATKLAEGFREQMPGRPCVIIMNKADLVTDADTVKLPASSVNRSLPLLRTSAATGQNVKHAFEYAAAAIRRRSL